MACLIKVGESHASHKNRCESAKCIVKKGCKSGMCHVKGKKKCVKSPKKSTKKSPKKMVFSYLNDVVRFKSRK